MGYPLSLFLIYIYIYIFFLFPCFSCSPGNSIIFPLFILLFVLLTPISYYSMSASIDVSHYDIWHFLKGSYFLFIQYLVHLKMKNLVLGIPVRSSKIISVGKNTGTSKSKTFLKLTYLTLKVVSSTKQKQKNKTWWEPPIDFRDICRLIHWKVKRQLSETEEGKSPTQMYLTCQMFCRCRWLFRISFVFLVNNSSSTNCVDIFLWYPS